MQSFSQSCHQRTKPGEAVFTSAQTEEITCEDESWYNQGRHQDRRVFHQLPQKSQDSLFQSSKLCIVSPLTPTPLLHTYCMLHLMYAHV